MFEVRVVVKDLVHGPAARELAEHTATVTHVSRTHGRPPILAGSMAIRSYAIPSSHSRS